MLTQSTDAPTLRLRSRRALSFGTCLYPTGSLLKDQTHTLLPHEFSETERCSYPTLDLKKAVRGRDWACLFPCSTQRKCHDGRNGHCRSCSDSRWCGPLDGGQHSQGQRLPIWSQPPTANKNELTKTTRSRPPRLDISHSRVGVRGILCASKHVFPQLEVSRSGARSLPAIAPPRRSFTRAKAGPLILTFSPKRGEGTPREDSVER